MGRRWDASRSPGCWHGPVSQGRSSARAAHSRWAAGLEAHRLRSPSRTSRRSQLPSSAPALEQGHRGHRAQPTDAGVRALSITALFWDLGGVLLTNGWDVSLRREAALVFGFDFGDFESRHARLVTDLETGRLALDDYLDSTIFYRAREFTK